MADEEQVAALPGSESAVRLRQAKFVAAVRVR